MKLSKIPHGQAEVYKIPDGRIRLVSYTTTVATITKEGYLEINGLYSATTRRHISAFMSEYTDYDYSVAKYCYEHGCKLQLSTGYAIDIHTGEIKKEFKI